MKNIERLRSFDIDFDFLESNFAGSFCVVCSILKYGSTGKCNNTGCKKCEFNSWNKCVDYLNSDYQEEIKSIKLSKFEYDLLKCYIAEYTPIFDPYSIFFATLKEKGYFKSINEKMNIYEILNKADVIEDEKASNILKIVEE